MKNQNVEHLRTFECTVYTHVPKDERKKLNMKTRKCVLLGYMAQKSKDIDYMTQ